MQTKVSFNTNVALKKAVAKKARAQGLTLSSVLNIASQAYVNNRFRIEGFEDKLALSVQQADAGLFISAAAARKKLRLS